MKKPNLIKDKIKLLLLPILSPTWLITNQIKAPINFKKILNIYLLVSLLTSFLVLLFPSLIQINILALLLLYFCQSRNIEIFRAYLFDSIDKMRKNTAITSGLNYPERFVNALKSYLEIINNYALVFFILNNNSFKIISTNENIFFNKTLENILEAIYFSANNVTILGYGEIYPTHPISQLFITFHVITGVFLLIVTFTIYVTLNFSSSYGTKENIEKTKKTNNRNLLPVQVLLIAIFLGLLIFFLN